MFVSLALGVVLWLHVQSLQVPAKPSPMSVDIATDTLDPIHFDLMSISSQSVKVTYTGDDPSRMANGKTKAWVDLTRPLTGQHPYKINVSPPPGVRPSDLKLSAKTVLIDVQPHVSRKLPVTMSYVGQPSEGFVFRGLTVTPDAVNVAGPKSLVAATKTVRAILDWRQFKPGDKLADKGVVSVEALDANGRPVQRVTCQPPGVYLAPELAPAPPHKSLVVTPTWSGSYAYGYEPALDGINVQPSAVDVTGKSEVLSRLVTIYTEPIAIQGLSQEKTFDAKLVIPKGVTVNGRTTVKVHLKVVKSPNGTQPTGSRPHD
jgi:YbbR domain-containing protein